MKKSIKDIKKGDKIMGTDGKWHKVVAVTPIRTPYKMYELTFSDGGTIKCSDTHQWNLYINDKMVTVDTMGMQVNFDIYKGCHIGTSEGPTFENIKEIPPEPVMCITTDSKDSQFLIYTNMENNDE